MLPAHKPLRSNTYLEPSATLRMNYHNWRTIWSNGRMFHPGRTVCRAALTRLDDLFQGFDQAFVPRLVRYALNGVEPNVEPGLRKGRSARSRYRCRPDR